MKLKKSSKKGTDVQKKDFINEDLFKVEELEPRLELGYIDGVCGNEVNGVCDTDVDAICGGGGGGGGTGGGEQHLH
jgi:hypothetical protein